jgi:hypothetical protein
LTARYVTKNNVGYRIESPISIYLPHIRFPCNDISSQPARSRRCEAGFQVERTRQESNRVWRKRGRRAAQLGWDFVYAAHINAAPADIERAFDRYRSTSGGRVPLLAISVVVADTRTEAARLADGFRRFRVQVGDAQAVNVGSLEQADAFVRQSGGGAHRIEERETHIVHGTRDDALRELGELQRRYGVAEFIVDTPITEAAPRIASLRLLAGGRDDTHTATDANVARAHHSLAVAEK